MRDAFTRPRSAEEMELAKLVAEGNCEAAEAIQTELQAQTLRLENAERVLASAKPTKNPPNDQRIATDKVARARRDLDDLQRKELLPRDERIYPGTYATVMVAQHGRKVIVPMRYQCRLFMQFKDAQWPPHPSWLEIVLVFVLVLGYWMSLLQINVRFGLQTYDVLLKKALTGSAEDHIRQAMGQ